MIGLGLPTVAMGLLSLFMKPSEAAAILLLPSFVTNVWQLAAGPDFRGLAHRLWPTLAAVFVGTVAAAGLITGGNGALVTAGLGIALIAYAVLGLMKVKMHVAPPRALGRPADRRRHRPRHRRHRRVRGACRTLSERPGPVPRRPGAGAGPVLHRLDRGAGRGPAVARRGGHLSRRRLPRRAGPGAGRHVARRLDQAEGGAGSVQALVLRGAGGAGAEIAWKAVQ